jgi:diketogulonate reductase-like aldo/keto reductase
MPPIDHLSNKGRSIRTLANSAWTSSTCLSCTSRFDLTIDAYRALERLLADGKVRAIGVSNFMPGHPEQLLKATSVVPAVNQIEMHPYFRQGSCWPPMPNTTS